MLDLISACRSSRAKVYGSRVVGGEHCVTIALRLVAHERLCNELFFLENGSDVARCRTERAFNC